MAAAQAALPAGKAKAAEGVSPPLAPAQARGKSKKLLLIAAPVALALLGAGLWFTGILPGLLGAGAKPAVVATTAPVFVEIPEMVANLNAGDGRDAYVKLRARIELGREADRGAALAAMPRLQDLFQTFLREMRPEELRGSEGTWRLREELLARANVALAPVHVTGVLFTELLVQ